jgi:adenosylcobyric acid synthase
MSNFTDYEPLVVDPHIELNFISNPTQAQNYDLLILPGSKRVVDDLIWLRKHGFEPALQDKNKKIIAICDGYEMMFETIKDPRHIESKFENIEGFGRFEGEVIFQKEKIVKNDTHNFFGVMGSGYEIHNGVAKKWQKAKNFYATFMHGIFDNDNLREMIFTQLDKNYQGYNFQQYKQSGIKNFTHHIREYVDIETIVNELYS